MSRRLSRRSGLTRLGRWIGPDEAHTIPLVNEELRPLLAEALA